jgi:hypothetical protein
VSEAPLLRIVNADATPEEVAALVAVFSAIGAGKDTPAPVPPSEWQAHHRKLRHVPPHGRGGWRSSGLPR